MVAVGSEPEPVAPTTISLEFSRLEANVSWWLKAIIFVSFCAQHFLNFFLRIPPNSTHFTGDVRSNPRTLRICVSDHSFTVLLVIHLVIFFFIFFSECRLSCLEMFKSRCRAVQHGFCCFLFNFAKLIELISQTRIPGYFFADVGFCLNLFFFIFLLFAFRQRI